MKMLKQGAGPAGRTLLAAAALVAAALVAGCGGGGGQIEPFAPKRIMAFGDEASVITAEGKKYTINAVDATTSALQCANNPIWIQSLASAFGLVFAECNPTNQTTPAGKIYAQPGATVAGLKAQLDTFFSSGGFNSKDLVAVMAGANDVLELYRQYPQQGADTLKAQARERGRELARQVNRIANADGRVIVATLPDMGTTPFALTERANKPDTDRAKLLSELTTEFNTQMRITLIDDGRLIGLVLINEEVERIVRFNTSYGFANVTEAACLATALAPECTSKTLVTNANGDTWLWATSTLMSPAGQSRLGSLAVSRAVNNPF
ncbi:SGNH/GDSL hydrolase family protein [Paucibacter sp. PLA-PC-4]|uniref:SGNH/GDSL hydrolase family protein n=1 Tax=Paucibacter sp. PLA-PC-4 TaxID=2993655 RepID=UPI0022487A02|nr:SGNH/GDSL hydrolase family protein [Paucibacter sp. PLA-PC-4]MCX2860743.1 SGNH/GDSL hydrolase family protein [Paucibacter sp. PLA-PC-4]